MPIGLEIKVNPTRVSEMKNDPPILRPLNFSAVSTRDSELETRSSALSELISANEELSRSRVVLEMKCVELEEQRDRWVLEEREVKQRMEEMRKELKVRY